MAELVGMNFALMPQHMPHVKMLNFVHWVLNRFMTFEKSLPDKNSIYGHGDPDLIEEVESTLASVGRYFDQINKDRSRYVTGRTVKLFNALTDKYNTQIFLPEAFPSQMFDYYWATLINTYALAKGGGKLLGGLTVYPYSQLLKFKDILPIKPK